MGKGGNDCELNVDHGLRHTGAAQERKRVLAGVAKLGLEAYEVGGSVRAELLGQPAKDIDICVAGTDFDELVKRASGISHVKPLTVADQQIGVRVTADWTPRDGVEIALCRREVSTGEGHQDFRIEPAPDVSISEDLSRRDFTCNAIARRITADGEAGELIDPFGGEQDIREGRLRMLSERTIAEDPLRILRGLVRNAADGLEPDPETLEAMKAHAHKLRPDGPLSSERIFGEIQKLMKAKDPGRALRLARDAGILTEVLPELAPMVGFDQESRYHGLTVDEHCFTALDRAAEKNFSEAVRWAALLHDCGKPAAAFRGEDGRLHYYRNPDDPDAQAHEDLGADITRSIMRRLRAPRELEDKVVLLVKEHMFGAEGQALRSNERKAGYVTRKLIQRVGLDNIDELVELRYCDRAGKGAEYVEAAEESYRKFSKLVRSQKNAPLAVQDLAVNGHDLMQAGLEGRRIGEVQRELLQRVITDPEHNNRERLLDWVDRIAGKKQRQPA